MQHLTLNTKQKMPALGLGTWQSDKGEVGKAIEVAVTKQRYRHIDCAHVYGNEPEIGQTFNKILKAKKVTRQDLFITSKLWNADHHPDKVEKACLLTLKNLQLDYLDLYLIHWGVSFTPKGTIDYIPLHQTWQAMESLVKKGLVKNIGVSNYTTPMILDLLSYAKIKPAVNQIEIHVYNFQPELVQYCQSHNIQITAYSPLGSSGDNPDKPLHNKTVKQIAKDHHKSPAQILLKWCIQRNLSVLAKSTNSQRIAENIDLFDFTLTDKQIDQLNQLNRNHRFIDPSDFWGIPYFK